MKPQQLFPLLMSQRPPDEIARFSPLSKRFLMSPEPVSGAPEIPPGAASAAQPVTNALPATSKLSVANLSPFSKQFLMAGK